MTMSCRLKRSPACAQAALGDRQRPPFTRIAGSRCSNGGSNWCRKTGVRHLSRQPLCHPPLHHDADGNANAGIIRVVQKIPAIFGINVNVVGVVPTIRPRLNKTEPKAAVLEARISIDHPWTADAKSMLAPKMGTEAIVRYAPFASGAEPQRRFGSLSGFILL